MSFDFSVYNNKNQEHFGTLCIIIINYSFAFNILGFEQFPGLHLAHLGGLVMQTYNCY